MLSRTLRGVSKWSRHKDRYIGRLYLDTEKVPITSRSSGIIPISPGTFSVSKYSRPIYRSLCPDHFETPRQVRDHIRDSEQPSVHQNI